MIRVLRRLQRKAVRSLQYESFSHLLMPRDNEFEPFGVLSCCLDTTQSKASEVRRGPFAETVMLTAVLEGRLTVGAGGQVLEGGQVAAITPHPEELISYHTEPGIGARYYEIGLIDSVTEPGIQVNPAGLRKDLPNPIFIPIASGQPLESSIRLQIDCTVHWGRLRAGETLIFETTVSRRTFVLLLRGTVRVAEERLLNRDCALIEQEALIPLSGRELSEFILIDLPV